MPNNELENVNNFTTAISEGSKATGKLLDLIKSFTDIWTEPKKEEMFNKKALKAIENIDEYLKNNPNSFLHINKDMLNSLNNDAKSLVESQICREIINQLKTYKNRLEILEIAYNNSKNSKSNNEEPISDEFKNKFMESTKYVTREDIKRIWAEVLLKEAEKPGMFSIRTLEILQNMSRIEAELFQKIAKNVILGDYLFDDDELLREREISYEDILELEDARLINSISMAKTCVIRDYNDIPLRDSIINLGFIMDSTSVAEIDIQGYRLSKYGRELISALPSDVFDKNYIIKCYEKLFKINPEVIFTIGYFELDDAGVEKFKINGRRNNI